MPPHDDSDWRECAASLRRAGRIDEAVHACRRAIEGVPGDAAAWSELSHALRAGGKGEDAKGAANRAIELDPRLASAWFNLGAILLAEGAVAQSIEAGRKAVELDPGFAEAWSNLGGALAAGGDKPGEMDAYRRALDINPGLAAVWSNLGNALREAGQAHEAVNACRRAVELDPGLAAAWVNLGNALLEAGENDEATSACDSAVRLAPALAEGWSALAGALHATRRYEAAIDAHRKALAIRPGDPQLHFHLGVTLQHCGRGTEAIPPLRRALEIEPDHAEAHFELSLALLAAGQLHEGWQEYEWRWRRPGAESRRHQGLPLWSGDMSIPCRLLVWGEQGIGDQIIYGSMINDVLSTPMAVTLEVDRRLVPLYRRSFPRLSVLPKQESPAAGHGSYDCQAPLASLGRWLRASFESFPRRRSFLDADPSRVDRYRARLTGNRAAAVAISWRSANREVGSAKSIELRDWLPILQLPDVRFVDLQYGDTESERRLVEQEVGARIKHLPDLDLYGDLEGVAALCAACELVITSSNVTAHIAGALGRPVWLIVPKGNGRFWYWFSGRSDSPWYPTMRIFDQIAPGSWRETLDGVARELAAFVERR
jgi:tetratricopeptide (TPR) repeat protein